MIFMNILNTAYQEKKRKVKLFCHVCVAIITCCLSNNRHPFREAIHDVFMKSLVSLTELSEEEERTGQSDLKNL